LCDAPGVVLESGHDAANRLADLQARLGSVRDQSAALVERAHEQINGQPPPQLSQLREQLAATLAEVDGLRTAMLTRGVIEQAKGMIMLTLTIDEDAAFDVLVRRSQKAGRKVVEIARDVVAHGSATGSFDDSAGVVRKID